MRITNLHLIVSFFLLSGAGFFAYNFFGLNRLPVSVSAPPIPVTSPAPTPAPDVRLIEARARAQATLRGAESAVEVAARDERDVQPLLPLLARARAAAAAARTPADHDAVVAAATEVLDAALVAPRARLSVYVVRRGDNLWNIAKRADVYGRGAKWVKIWRANEKKVPDFDKLVSGQELAIPRE